MPEIQLKFQGSPEKFGKAAYCDLFYTQSKLYDNVLYKDLISFRDIMAYKADFITAQALKDQLQNRHYYSNMEKNQIIQSQNQQIRFLQQKNRQILIKNRQRIKKLIENHNNSIQSFIKQKQEEVLLIQCQKQLLENRIKQLQDLLQQKSSVLSTFQKQRNQIHKKESQHQKQVKSLRQKINEQEKLFERMDKECREKVNKIQEEKLQIELYFKKMMVERSSTGRQQMEELMDCYEKKLEGLQQQKLLQSLKLKQTINKLLKNTEIQNKDHRHKIQQFQEKFEGLIKEIQFQKQKNASLNTDIQKQDDILDKYEDYLKQSDQSVKKLQQLLVQSQQQLQKAKVSLQKSSIERDSLRNRIKISEEEANMWRQSYYLNKSRIQMDF